MTSFLLHALCFIGLFDDVSGTDGSLMRSPRKTFNQGADVVDELMMFNSENSEAQRHKEVNDMVREAVEAIKSIPKEGITKPDTTDPGNGETTDPEPEPEPHFTSAGVTDSTVRTLDQVMRR